MRLVPPFLAIVFAPLWVALSLPPPCYSQVGTAREQFRAFYEPKLPRLKSSYGGVRFESAMVKKAPAATTVQVSRGDIQLSNFIFDRFPDFSIDLWPVTADQVSEKIDRQVLPVQSGGWIDDYAFEVQYAGQAKSLNVFPNQYSLEADFDPCIIAPLCSVSLRRTYESIMNDDDYEILDFFERFSQSGQKTKSLFFFPRGNPRMIYEVNFDPDSGACIASQEPQPQRPEQTIQFKTTYAKSDASPDSAYLPPPVKITRSFGSQATTLILKYERLTPAQQSVLSVTRYGFDETEITGPSVEGSKVAVYAAPILMVACLVLFFILTFFCFLALLIGWITKRKGQQKLASESDLDASARSRSDLSEP